MLHIFGYSRIRRQKLMVNGRTVYQAQDPGFSSFLDNAFASLQIMYPKFFKMDHMSKAGFLAAEVLVLECQEVTGYSPESVALVLANSYASLDTDLQYFESMKTFASPSLFVYTLANIVTGEICIRHGFKGENAFFVAKEFSPHEMHEYVEVMMASRHNLACIAGWVNVLGDQNDVFLYLVHKRPGSSLASHTIDNIEKFYNADN